MKPAFDNTASSTFVLVHGAWHSAQCWHKLIPLLEAQGHKVLAPDLPGHALNAAPGNKVSLNLYSRYILQLINNTEENVVLVGHSMGGMVISQVAELIPQKITQLVYLCAFLPQNKQSVFDLIALERNANDKPSAIEQALVMSPDKRSCHIKAEAIAGLFYGQCSKADLNAALSDFSSQASLPLANKVKLGKSYDSVERSYICGLNDRVIPLSQQHKMLVRQPCSNVITLDCDHSPFLSNPVTLSNTLTQLTCIKPVKPKGVEKQ